jgi:hypothetical protein
MRFFVKVLSQKDIKSVRCITQLCTQCLYIPKTLGSIDDLNTLLIPVPGDF